MRKRKREENGFNIWRSYSDMMAGVLLLFVLIMCVTLFQAQKNYDDSIREHNEKLAMQQAYTSEIEDRESQISSQKQQLEDQQATLASQQTTLDEQQKILAAQQTTLDEQKATLASQQEKLTEQENQLATQQTALQEKTDQLAAQQAKIDNIIGVKADVIEALNREFTNNNINVNIDAHNGAMTLESNVMFDPTEAVLKEEGKAVLSQVLPIYCKVLLQEGYFSSVAEIIIAGYADSVGDYIYNLELSQQRALAVSEYLLEIAPNFLSAKEYAMLEGCLSVNGYSKSNLIYDANGNEDKDASRRVEVKFRLKDEEMMQELNKILSSAE